MSYPPIVQNEDRKSREKAAYDKAYSGGCHFNDLSLRESILSKSELCFSGLIQKYCRGAETLEIGCGTGEHACLAAKLGAASVVGIDISEEGVKVAKARAHTLGIQDRIRFEVTDVEHLPYPDNTFDLIINHEVFSSVDIYIVLPEIRRVLKPGGHLISIECFGHNPIFNLNRALNVRKGRRTQWAAEHILCYRDIEYARRFFNTNRIQYFHLVGILLAPIIARLPQDLARNASRNVDKLDGWLTKMPGVRSLSFKVVMDWM